MNLIAAPVSPSATHTQQAAQAPQTIEFKVPLGYQVDESKMALHAALLSYADHHKCSYEQAVRAHGKR